MDKRQTKRNKNADAFATLVMTNNVLTLSAPEVILEVGDDEDDEDLQELALYTEIY